MPQQGGRKKPFSAKQKKKQLQERRERKKDKEESGAWGGRGHGHREEQTDRSASSGGRGSRSESEADLLEVKKIHQQPRGQTRKGYDPNRFRLHFQRESKAELQKRKELARQTLTMLPEISLEMDLEEMYRPGSELDMPKRPPWDYNMSKEKVQSREENYFREYVEKLMEKYGSEELSYFELNLETWQQLWRVLEMADIVLLITDIRHPALHFSPALYNYVTNVMKKSLILVLNKIDLAPPALVVAWKEFFQKRFPDVHIVTFTSFPKDKVEADQLHQDPGKLIHKKRRKGAFSALGPKQLLEACEKIVQGKVDLSGWRTKIEGEMAGDDDVGEDAKVTLEEQDGSFHQHEEYHDGVLTIGCCGYPNVGKSSLMNGLVGHKVVSVSKTPGHTKHFQTIYLTPKVKLCDSPGLVFPSLVPKPLQILAGIYPIAQVREPFTAVGFLSERLDLPHLLKLRHPDETGNDPSEDASDVEWSAMDVCEAWALKRGFLTAKAARPDTFRAANHLLRLALDGRICLCMRPPGYTNHKAFWESQPETVAIVQQQEAHRLVHAAAKQTWDSDEGLHIPDSEEEYERIAKEHRDEDRDVNEASSGNSSGEDDSEEEEENTAVSTSNPFALLNNQSCVTCFTRLTLD